MLSKNEIYETVAMIKDQNLDVRTITMSLGLFDCIDADKKKTAQKVYEKIVRFAGRLVETGNVLSAEYGIPIVNKRVAVTPVSFIGAASGGFTEIARALDKAAKEIGIDFIGGYSALVQKGATPAEERFLDSIPDAVSMTEKVCSSVAVGSTKAGINMDAVAKAGLIIKALAEKTKDKGGVGCAKFVVFCNAVEDNPFMAGAFTGTGEADAAINVGVSGPGVVENAVRKFPNANLTELAEIIKKSLSSQDEYYFTQDGAFMDQDGAAVNIAITVAREEFEELIAPTLEGTMEKCREALAEAEEKGVTLDDIDAVLLVGGSTHIPLVREFVRKNFCDESLPSHTMEPMPLHDDPDMAVGFGAAVSAALGYSEITVGEASEGSQAAYSSEVQPAISTSLGKTQVTGTVRVTGGKLPAGMQAEVTKADNSFSAKFPIARFVRVFRGARAGQA